MAQVLDGASEELRQHRLATLSAEVTALAVLTTSE